MMVLAGYMVNRWRKAWESKWIQFIFVDTETTDVFLIIQKKSKLCWSLCWQGDDGPGYGTQPGRPCEEQLDEKEYWSVSLVKLTDIGLIVYMILKERMIWQYTVMVHIPYFSLDI